MGRLSRTAWIVMAAASSLVGQINPPRHVSLVSQVTRPDVDAWFGLWGWSAPDGREFAVVGCNTGILVRRLDSGSTAEWFFDDAGAPGSGVPFYRDVAVYGSRAYSIGYTHTGIRVIDLAPASGPVDLGWILPGLWLNAHTIQVDPDLGYLFVSGATKTGTTDRPLVVVDVSNPSTPRSVVEYSGKQNVVGPPPSEVKVLYDTFARRGLVYTSEHRPGGSLFRILEPAGHGTLNTTLPLAEFPQLTGETHSSWVSEDDRIFVALHEGIGASNSGHIVFWDIAGLRLQPPVAPAPYLKNGNIATYGTPFHTVHNAHGMGRSLYLAHFTDGFHLASIADPSNVVPVAYYDTTAVAPGGQLGPPIGMAGVRVPSSYYGAWDVYPYLDSGLILVTDLLNGLHVLRVEKGHFNRYGSGVANPGGTIPRMTAGGDVPRSGGTGFSIELDGLAPNQWFWALFSLAEDPVRPIQPILNIPVYIDLGASYLGFVVGVADAAGRGSIPLPIPDPTPVPWIYAQVVQLDPATARASTSRGTWFGIAP